MHFYMKNNHAKFHPDPIWNDEALGFFEERPQQEQEEQGEYSLVIYGISFWSIDPKMIMDFTLCTVNIR